MLHYITWRYMTWHDMIRDAVVWFTIDRAPPREVNRRRRKEPLQRNNLTYERFIHTGMPRTGRATKGSQDGCCHRQDLGPPSGIRYNYTTCECQHIYIYISYIHICVYDIYIYIYMIYTHISYIRYTSLSLSTYIYIYIYIYILSERNSTAKPRSGGRRSCGRSPYCGARLQRVWLKQYAQSAY